MVRHLTGHSGCFIKRKIVQKHGTSANLALGVVWALEAGLCGRNFRKLSATGCGALPRLCKLELWCAFSMCDNIIFDCVANFTYVTKFGSLYEKSKSEIYISGYRNRNRENWEIGIRVVSLAISHAKEKKKIVHLGRGTYQ